MSRTRRYITNVIWNSASVGVLLVVGFLMSPFILRHIGEKKYGEWALVLSLVEYYWLIDLGFRSATVKFSAEFGTIRDDDRLSELLSTGFAYASLTATAIILIALLSADWIARLWHVGQPEFPTLLRIVGVAWGLGMVANIFGGCLEGFQQFGALSRIWMVATVLRSAGVALALFLGYGVLAMGWALFIAQILSYVATWIAFRRAAPRVKVSWVAGTKTMARTMANYGVHTLTAQVATRLMNYSVPVLIGYLLPIEYLAYWSVPVKIMETAFDGIGRIGMVTTPSAAEFAAKGEHRQLRELGVHANRYCLSLFIPIAAFLLVYGREVYSLWVRKPEFVAHSSFLLPILVLGYAAVAGQFNSASILYGLGRHKTYVRCLLVEAVLTAAGVAAVLPRWGLFGAAWVIAVMMTLNRAVVVAALFAREVHVNLLGYVGAIYWRPGLLGAGMGALLWFLKRTWLPGQNWFQVIAALAVAGSAYAVLAGVFVLTPEHRRQLLGRLAPAPATVAAP